MLGDMIALGLISLLVIGPLVWRNLRDRREADALRLQARLQSVANRRLGGETFLVVTVQPGLAGRGGRVVLTAPPRWQWLVQDVWSEVRRAMPADHELVVSGGGDPDAREPRPLAMPSAARAA